MLNEKILTWTTSMEWSTAKKISMYIDWVKVWKKEPFFFGKHSQLIRSHISHKWRRMKKFKDTVCFANCHCTDGLNMSNNTKKCLLHYLTQLPNPQKQRKKEKFEISHTVCRSFSLLRQRTLSHSFPILIWHLCCTIVVNVIKYLSICWTGQ